MGTALTESPTETTYLDSRPKQATMAGDYVDFIRAKSKTPAADSHPKRTGVLDRMCGVSTSSRASGNL
jgi:hypothetical protein